ncbi:hypothetical protein O1611_g3519 [Lasiodiplodia mahajangana]|uniref:Uncharacterized protein n=1 Tax=Lasiodiplodia mahajangana TaxID=1108764 RepID=A0ACC2JRS3_9PEZI|nr:hypothetical protein O1611_g3519 [Lasiodiplodia mahajangana]
MSLLCCCRNRQQPAEKETQTPVIQLPIQPPRARLSKTLSRSDTNMYLSSLLASRGPSQVVIPAYHNIVDPEAVDAEDSDEDGPERDTHGSNTGTLGSFRTRLIRRISHRVETKAGSRPSAGTSEEELARRAELKRLMHKRIQEELKSEEEEEENDNGDLGLAQPKRHSIDNCKEPELPGGGPRDTIEFTVSGADEQGAENEVGMLLETSPSQTPVIDRPQGAYQQQRTTCSESVKRSTDGSYQECNVSINEAESIIRPPSPPHLTPVHLLGGNGRESPSTASWRLSYSAIHIESYIEPLVEARQVSIPPSPEQENVFSRQEGDVVHTQEADTTTNYSNLTIHDETIDTSQTMQFDQGVALDRNYKESDISSDLADASDGRYSPLDVWLRSQDLHCASLLSSRPNSEMALENYEYGLQEQTENPQKTEMVPNLSMHQDQIARRGLISQEHVQGVGPELAKDISNEREASITAPSNESIALYEVLNRMENAFPPHEPLTEDQTPDVSSRYTSSRYTTRPNSQQATPRSSRLSLAELLVGRRIPQHLSPIYGSVSPYHTTTSVNSDMSSYQTALNKTPSIHAKSNPELSQFSNIEAFSANASETASFRQREEELKSIKKRFGLTPARRHPTATVRSKFREEFEGSKGPNSGRNSILSRLYFVFPKRARASRSHTELNGSNEWAGIHSADFRKYNKTKLDDLGSSRDRDLPSNMASNIRLGEMVAEQREITQEAEHHHGRLNLKPIGAPMPIAKINDSEARSVCMNNCDLNITKIPGPGEAREPPVENSFPLSEDRNSMAMSNEGKMRNTVDIHAGVLQEWVGQLQAEDQQRQSRMESKINVTKQQPPRFRTPPESWARWPSHTREERTASAGKKDKVNSRDFAVVGNPKHSEIEAGGREPTMTSRTLSSQVSKVFKSGWNKMVTHTSSVDRASDHKRDIRRIRESRDFLEYPELELLPNVGGYREVQALDQQIDTMKRRSSPGEKSPRQSNSDSVRHPLASRIAEEIHRFQAEDQATAWTETRYHVKGPPTTQFILPKHSLFTPRPKSCDPELSGASESQCMYEDCVQAHILHDGDDSNRIKAQDRTTIKRAKSTGNIEVRLSGDRPLMDESTPSNHGPIHKAWKSGLRRHQSLGWIRGRSRGDEHKPAVIG